MSSKCVFLDRDGVINEERGDWTYRIEDFQILPGVEEALQKFKSAGYLTIIITNQSGISKGLYSVQEMNGCHEYMQDELGHRFDDIYFAPYHPTITESLGRKPGSLLFERAIAQHSVDIKQSWMIGDKDRDLIPARRLGLKTILIGEVPSDVADYYSEDLRSTIDIILG